MTREFKISIKSTSSRRKHENGLEIFAKILAYEIIDYIMLKRFGSCVGFDYVHKVCIMPLPSPLELSGCVVVRPREKQKREGPISNSHSHSHRALDVSANYLSPNWALAAKSALIESILFKVFSFPSSWTLKDATVCPDSQKPWNPSRNSLVRNIYLSYSRMNKISLANFITDQSCTQFQFHKEPIKNSNE